MIERDWNTPDWFQSGCDCSRLKHHFNQFQSQSIKINHYRNFLTIYDNHTLEPLKELGLDSHKDLRNLLSSFMFILSISLQNLFIPDVPFPALLLTLIRRRFQVKPATLLTPINIVFSFAWWSSFTVPGTKAPVPYLIWGVVFTACCLVFSLFFFYEN